MGYRCCVCVCGGLGRPVYLGSNMLVGGKVKVMVCSCGSFFSFFEMGDPSLV